MEHISRLPGLGEVLAGGRFVISQRVKRSPCSSIGLSSSITPPLCIAPLIRPATATNTLNLVVVVVVVVGGGGGDEPRIKDAARLFPELRPLRHLTASRGSFQVERGGVLDVRRRSFTHF